MNAEAGAWVDYADENLAVAGMAMEGGLYNACLQNVQQAVEKYLKAFLLHRKADFPKTHSIEMLNRKLARLGITTDLSEEDCDFLDSIYLPSKYPLGNVLPDFTPDAAICAACIKIAEKVRGNISCIKQLRSD